MHTIGLKCQVISMTAALEDHNRTLTPNQEELGDGAPIPAGEGREAIDPVPVPRLPRPNNELRATERGAAAMWEDSFREAWAKDLAPPLLLAMVAAAAPNLAPSTTTAPRARGRVALDGLVANITEAIHLQQQRLQGAGAAGGGGGGPLLPGGGRAALVIAPAPPGGLIAAAPATLVDLSGQDVDMATLLPVRSPLLLQVQVRGGDVPLQDHSLCTMASAADSLS